MQNLICECQFSEDDIELKWLNWLREMFRANKARRIECAKTKMSVLRNNAFTTTTTIVLIANHMQNHSARQDEARWLSKETQNSPDSCKRPLKLAEIVQNEVRSFKASDDTDKSDLRSSFIATVFWRPIDTVHFIHTCTKVFNFVCFANINTTVRCAYVDCLVILLVNRQEWVSFSLSNSARSDRFNE